MKRFVYEQFSVIKENNAEDFTEHLNEKLCELRAYNPIVQFSEADPLCAYIKYIVDESIPETIIEASAAEGIRFRCRQCPNYQAPKRADGEIDQRKRYGYCEFCESKVYRDASACEELYRLIADRNVVVCVE